MRHAQLTLTQMERARLLAEQQGALKGSFTGGYGRMAGFMAEIALFDSLKADGHNVKHENTEHYDLVWNGQRTDVKAKRCTSQPQVTYSASVPTYRRAQDCDRYFFARVKEDSRDVWLCGWEEVDAFKSKARILCKGELDGNTGWECKEDCYSLPIGDLQPFPTYQINGRMMAACLWAMDTRHTEHVKLLHHYGDLYCYHGLLWLRCVWERDIKHPRYMDVIGGRASIVQMREDLSKPDVKGFMSNLFRRYKSVRG